MEESEWRFSTASARSALKQLPPEFRGDVRRRRRCAGAAPKAARAGISNCLPSDLRSASLPTLPAAGADILDDLNFLKLRTGNCWSPGPSCGFNKASHPNSRGNLRIEA